MRATGWKVENIEYVRHGTKQLYNLIRQTPDAASETQSTANQNTYNKELVTRRE